MLSLASSYIAGKYSYIAWEMPWIPVYGLLSARTPFFFFFAFISFPHSLSISPCSFPFLSLLLFSSSWLSCLLPSLPLIICISVFHRASRSERIFYKELIVFISVSICSSWPQVKESYGGYLSHWKASTTLLFSRWQVQSWTTTVHFKVAGR